MENVKNEYKKSEIFQNINKTRIGAKEIVFDFQSFTLNFLNAQQVFAMFLKAYPCLPKNIQYT
jgi:hypothetical protein